MTKLEIIKDILDRACANKCDISIRGNGSMFYTTGDDSSGQRGAYLEHWGYGTPDPKSLIYKVKRKLSFINKGDEGKEDAVLFLINIKEIASLPVTVSDGRLTIGDLYIYFYDKKSIWEEVIIE